MTLLIMANHCATASAAAVVDVAYSHRQVGSGWSEPDFSEGFIRAIFSADRQISLLEPDTTFARIDSMTFERQFQWWETDTLTVIFVDRAQEQTEVRAFPEPVYPLEPTNHAVPVVNITTDRVNLWSPATGIYVWGDHHNWNRRGDDWERQAFFDYWNADGDLAISRPVGIRIHGGYSRSYSQKSLRLYFDHDGDPEYLHFPFFNDEEGDYGRLLVRSCYHPGKFIDDRWACSLFADMGHLISNFSFIVAFLNGEYWGAYHLRERFDEEWAETTLGLDDDEYLLILDGEARHGDPADWWDFLAWASAPADYSSHDFFIQAASRLDLEIYIDWLLVNIFAAPSDNGYAHNLGLLKVEHQPWRFLMWDEDDLFPMVNLYSDYFRFFSAADETEFLSWLPPEFGTDIWAEVEQWFGLFNHLLQNAEFRTLFFSRFDELVADLMAQESLLARLESIVDEQGPEADWHGNKYWYGTGGPYHSYAGSVEYWINNRYPVFLQQAAEFRADWLAPVELSWFAAAVEVEGHRLSWRTETESDCVGYLVYAATAATGPFTLVADHDTAPELIAQGAPGVPAEYTFLVSDAPDDEPTYYRLSHLSSVQGEVVHNWVEGVNLPLPALCLNEFMARNSTIIADETGAYEDWLEIHNSGELPVDLGGMFLSDELAEDTQWPFPEGTIIPAGGFLLIWCDDDEEDGPLHTCFKLDGDGEVIALFDRLDNGHQLIDSYSFGAQSEDVSEGRQCDCCGDWQFFTAPTPAASNNSASAVRADRPPQLAITAVYPNPFNPITTVAFTVPARQEVRLVIFDTAGRRVRLLLDGVVSAGQNRIVWDGRDNHGRALASGVYQLRLVSAGDVRSHKLTLLK